jgi:hypothetical protein
MAAAPPWSGWRAEIGVASAFCGLADVARRLNLTFFSNLLNREAPVLSYGPGQRQGISGPLQPSQRQRRRSPIQTPGRARSARPRDNRPAGGRTGRWSRRAGAGRERPARPQGPPLLASNVKIDSVVTLPGRDLAAVRAGLGSSADTNPTRQRGSDPRPSAPAPPIPSLGCRVRLRTAPTSPVSMRPSLKIFPLFAFASECAIIYSEGVRHP